METLLVVDVQNEFSEGGLRPVPNHVSALQQIHRRVDEARRDGSPIAWVLHHNKPHESRAFVPGSWGAELSPGLGPNGLGPEKLFEKDVFGAFTGTPLETWLREVGTTQVLIVGFYAHMCVSTSAREALIRGFQVSIDPEATGSRDIDDPALGFQTADEVRRSALLHLTNMGATIAAPITSTSEVFSTSGVDAPT
jgi:nicotinamidase-related amidase